MAGMNAKESMTVIEKSRFYFPWAVFGLFGLVCGIISVFVFYRVFEPAPKKAFYGHREEIMKYVESINLGRIPKRSDRSELYRSLDVLDAIRFIDREQGCGWNHCFCLRFPSL